MQTGKANEEINKNISETNVTKFDFFMLKEAVRSYPFTNLGYFTSYKDACDVKNQTRISSSLQVIGINFTVIHE